MGPITWKMRSEAFASITVAGPAPRMDRGWRMSRAAGGAKGSPRAGGVRGGAGGADVEVAGGREVLAAARETEDVDAGRNRDGVRAWAGVRFLHRGAKGAGADSGGTHGIAGGWGGWVK